MIRSPDKPLRPAKPADPADVPVRLAATIMLLEDRPDLHVLLLRRRAGSAFVGGMVVFPGGGVDDSDLEKDGEALCPGLTDAEASKRLGLPEGGLAFYVAAIRETFEEAGVLLALDAESGSDPEICLPEHAVRFAALRSDVDMGRIGMLAAARCEGLALAVSRVHYTARWITPVGPPRRYDTRFFVAALPPGQQARHDDREAVHSEWLRPAEAIRRFEAEEMAMLPPTYGMLRTLLGFDRADEAVRAAAQHEDGADHVARLSGGGDRWKVVMPGDSGYDDADREMSAWVRLWPQNLGERS